MDIIFMGREKKRRGECFELCERNPSGELPHYMKRLASNCSSRGRYNILCSMLKYEQAKNEMLSGEILINIRTLVNPYSL